MVITLFIGGAALIAVPGLTRRLGRRLPQAEWARLTATCLAVGALSVELSLLLLAAPTVLRAGHVHGWALACEKVLGPLVPGGPVAGWLAGAAALLLPAVAVITAFRARQGGRHCRAEESLGEHSSYRSHELVILPTSEPVALTVGGPAPQILVSEGIVGMLTSDQLEAVLHHEAAHLEHRHDRFLWAVAGIEKAFRWVPGTRSSARAIRAALERWADEVAVAGNDERRTAVKEALLGVTLAAVGPGIAAFSAAESVMERLEALSDRAVAPSSLRRAMIYCPGVVLGTTLVLATAIWLGQASGILGSTGHCPV